MLDFFRKKKQIPVDFSGVANDMHSHLLPGIDDGSPDIATSAALISGMRDLGFTGFTTTPHIMWDLYQNDATSIGNAAASLRADNTVDLPEKFGFAAEYFLDDHLSSLLDLDVPLLTIKDNLLLFEFSFVNTPFDFKELIFKMQIKGYQPILAHPERYLYLKDNKAVYDELKSAGCFFQLNILSLIGYYGRVSTDIANYLISKNYIDLLGSDLHHQRHLDALRNSGSIMPTINELLDSGKLLNTTL